MFTAPNPLLCTSACICCVMIMRRSFTMSVIVRSYQISVYMVQHKNVNHSVLCRPLNTSCDHILSSQGKKFRLRFFSCFYVSFLAVAWVITKIGYQILQRRYMPQHIFYNTLSNRHSALIISLLQYWCYKNNIKGIFGHFRWIRSLIFKRSFSFYLLFPVCWHKCCSLNSTIVAYIEWLLFLIKQKCYRENTAISDNYF